MYDFDDLKKQARELQRLKQLREGLLREVLDAKRQKVRYMALRMQTNPLVPCTKAASSLHEGEALVSSGLLRAAGC